MCRHLQRLPKARSVPNVELDLGRDPDSLPPQVPLARLQRRGERIRIPQDLVRPEDALRPRLRKGPKDVPSALRDDDRRPVLQLAHSKGYATLLETIQNLPIGNPIVHVGFLLQSLSQKACGATRPDPFTGSIYALLRFAGRKRGACHILTQALQGLGSKAPTRTPQDLSVTPPAHDTNTGRPLQSPAARRSGAPRRFVRPPADRHASHLALGPSATWWRRGACRALDLAELGR